MCTACSQVYDLATLQLRRFLEAHNGVLLCLDFSAPPGGAGSAPSCCGGGGGCLLASGGRDGLIHLYDAAVSGFNLRGCHCYFE